MAERRGLTQLTNFPRVTGSFLAIPVAAVAVEDPDQGSVTLLMGFEGADASTTMTDESLQAHTAVAVANAQIDTAQFKFGSSSLLLDGTGDYIDIPTNDSFEIDDRAMTIEGFIRLNEVDRLQIIVSKRPDGVAHSWQAKVSATNKLTFSGWDTGVGQEAAVGTTSLVVDTWYHVAFVTEADGTWSIYLDGVLEDATAAGTSVSGAEGVLSIGHQINNIETDFNGHIDELRITTGVARYTANFTSPTAAFARFAASDDFAKVVLLAGFNGLDAATAFTEESANAAVATFVNSAQLDTAQKKFGTASALFNIGTADYLTFPDIGVYDLNKTDFTIECFVRFDNLPTSGNKQSWLGQWDNSGAQKSWNLQLFNNGGTQTFRWLYSTNGTTTLTKVVNWTPTADTWHHFAVTRNGKDLKFFVDGVQQGATQNLLSSFTIHNSTETMLLGGLQNGGTPIFPLDGWVDEVRITPGFARYKANFTAPSIEFPRA